MQNDLSAILSRLNSIDVSIGILSNKMENLHSKVNAFNYEFKIKIDRHDEILHGNGKPGILPILNTLKSDFDKHDKSDGWFHKTIILTGIGAIGFLVKIVFFK